MCSRVVTSLAGAILLSLGAASAAPLTGNWQAAQILSFRDFDDVDVKLDGEVHKAFLVGLRPIRESRRRSGEQERVRNAVRTMLEKSELFAQVMTRRAEVVGLSVDAFAHRKHGFDHPWDPSKYPYCWTGWGAYNFNAYFLYAKVTTFQDNFGENKHWRERFSQAFKELEGNGKK
jgi:hypothetical protein